VEDSIPAAGQGALGIEIRSGSSEVAAMLAALNHGETAACVRAERQVSRVLGGSCQVPLGAHAVLQDGRLVLNGFVANPDGSGFIQDAADRRRERSGSGGPGACRQAAAHWAHAPFSTTCLHEGEPLAGRTVLVTRPAHQAAALAQA
jgi:hydroxymethylbilane synthase